MQSPLRDQSLAGLYSIAEGTRITDGWLNPGHEVGSLTGIRFKAALVSRPA